MTEDLYAILLDANAVLHFPPPSELDWRQLTGHSDVVLVIYPLLLSEISKAKDMSLNKAIRKRARDRERWFDLRLAQPNEPIGSGVSLDVVDQEPSVDYEALHLDPKLADDRVIAFAIEYSSRTGRQVGIATRDRGLRLKLRSRQIDSIPLPENQILPSMPDPDREARVQAEQELARFQKRLPQISIDIVECLKMTPQGDFSLSKDDFVRSQLRTYHDRTPKIDCNLESGAGRSWELVDYNRYLDEYYQDVREYLEGLWLWADEAGRLVKLVLQARNSGTNPATNLRILLTFPEAPVCLRQDQVRAQPRPPEVPSLERVGAWRLQRYSAKELEAAKRYMAVPTWQKSGTQIERGRNVKFECARVSHHDVALIDPFYLRFDDIASVTHIACNVSILADELLDPTTIHLKLPPT